MNGRERQDWPTTAMHLAFEIANCRSEDPDRQIGAAIIKSNGDIVLGYNGAPKGVEIDWSNDEEKKPRVIHAEANALSRIQYGEAKFIAVTHLPCPVCMNVIKQKGVNDVYYSKILASKAYDSGLAMQLAKDYKINLIHLDYDPRRNHCCKQ